MQLKRLVLVLSLMAIGSSIGTRSWANEVSSAYSVDPSSPVDTSLGIRLPPGFRATIFADLGWYARHMAVREDGTVYLAMTVRMPLEKSFNLRCCMLPASLVTFCRL